MHPAAAAVGALATTVADPAAGVGVLAAVAAAGGGVLSGWGLPRVPGALRWGCGGAPRACPGCRARRALRLGFYSGGLGVPFLVPSLAFTRMTLMFGYIKRPFGAIVFAGGAVLIAMGVLVWTGELFQLNIEAQNFLRGTGLDFFNSV